MLEQNKIYYKVLILKPYCLDWVPPVSPQYGICKLFISDTEPYWVSYSVLYKYDDMAIFLGTYDRIFSNVNGTYDRFPLNVTEPYDRFQILTLTLR